MHKLTQDRLRELFDFDAEAGVLIWRVRPAEAFAKLSDANAWNARFAGRVAGCINVQGYCTIKIDDKMRQAHRLIWIYINGSIPAGIQIDHVNGVRSDNRLANLRMVTNAENQRNRSMPRDNTSGVMGVDWKKRDRKWRAQIVVAGRNMHLGNFDTLEAAATARAKAERDYGYHPGHGKVLETRNATSL